MTTGGLSAREQRCPTQPRRRAEDDRPSRTPARSRRAPRSKRRPPADRAALRPRPRRCPGRHRQRVRRAPGSSASQRAERRTARRRRPDRDHHHLPDRGFALPLRAGNLVNLLQQAAEFVVLGMAEIFVLLLGEIDLSLGYSGAVGAAVMTILAYPPINLGWAARDPRRARDERRDRLHPGSDHLPPAASAVRRDARGTAVLGGLPDLGDQQPEPIQRRLDPDHQHRRSTTSSTAISASRPAGSCSPSRLVL